MANIHELGSSQLTTGPVALQRPGLFLYPERRSHPPTMVFNRVFPNWSLAFLAVLYVAVGYLVLTL